MRTHKKALAVATAAAIALSGMSFASAAEAVNPLVPSDALGLGTPVAPSTLGTNYYVDSAAADGGDGSIEKPFNKLEQVNAITLQPGDGICLKTGSIFDDQKLAPKGRGTAEKPIIITSYGEGEMPVIHAGGYMRDPSGAKNDDGTPKYLHNMEAILIENMEYTTVSGIEVTNDDVFNETSDANDPNNWKGKWNDTANQQTPRRIGIHVTVDERAETINQYKQEGDRAFNSITIDGCYIHDVDGNENRKNNKGSGGIDVEVIYDGSKQDGNRTTGGYDRQPSDLDGKFLPYFDGVTLKNNKIQQVDRTGIKAIRLTNYNNFKWNDPSDTANYDPLCDFDNDAANDSSRYEGIRRSGDKNQANRNLVIENNDLSDVGGDGILVCEAAGALVEHNLLFNHTIRATQENAGIWSWNALDTTFRFNESYGGPISNQDGNSYDSDYFSAGTTFEYNYSHDTPMGFMLVMGSTATDVIRYNISQNDGCAFRHTASTDYDLNGSEKVYSPGYIYNNVFYYNGDSDVYNNDRSSNWEFIEGGSEASMGGGRGWELYNNIFYNADTENASVWGNSEKWSQLKTGGNIVYEASGKHSPFEIPAVSTEDPQFVNPGSGVTNGWASLNGYQLQPDSPAIGTGVEVNITPVTTRRFSDKYQRACNPWQDIDQYPNWGNVQGGFKPAVDGQQPLWDAGKDRTAATDFYGNPADSSISGVGVTPSVASLSIQAPPEKTFYWVGEGLDFAGLAITATLTNGTTEVITDGYTVLDVDMSTVGEKTVTVTYAGKTAAYTILVSTKADKSALEALLNQLNGIDLTQYTDASVAAFTPVLELANSLMADETLTQDDQAVIDRTTAELKTAAANLELKQAPADSPSSTPSASVSSTSSAGGSGSSKDPHDSAQTGDAAPLVGLGALMAAAGAAAVLIKRKK